jgi:peptidoglycan pentaglycine glycine transferase (the first glycine)
MQIKELTKEEYLKFSEELNVHPLQSFAWGELKRPIWEQLRLGAFDDEECVSIFTILIRKMPVVGKKFGYIPRGIAVKDEKYYQQILTGLVGAENFLPVSFALIDPETYKYSITNDPDFAEAASGKQLSNKTQYPMPNTSAIISALKNAGFKPSARQEQPIRTVVLDLSKSEEELMSDMRSKHRQYIRKAFKKGVVIEEGNDGNIDDFIRVLEQIVKERGYALHTMNYYRRVWQLFNDSGRNMINHVPTAKLFLAKHENKIIGSYMLLFSKDGAYEMFGGCGEEGKRLYANYAMKWEAIKYSKGAGKKYYDQWGAEEMHPGLKQFKEGFGGQIVKYPKQYVYVKDKLGYWMYKLMRKVDNVGRNIFRPHK